MQQADKPGVGGAILGFYGAIKICDREGLSPEDVFKLVLDFVRQEHDKQKLPSAPTPGSQ